MANKENGTAQRAPDKESASSKSNEMTEKQAFGQKISGLIPPWAKEGVRSPRVWKNFARCMIATFATLVLLVDNKSKSRPCTLQRRFDKQLFSSWDKPDFSVSL